MLEVIGRLIPGYSAGLCMFSDSGSSWDIQIALRIKAERYFWISEITNNSAGLDLFSTGPYNTEEEFQEKPISSSAAEESHSLSLSSLPLSSLSSSLPLSSLSYL